MDSVTLVATDLVLDTSSSPRSLVPRYKSQELPDLYEDLSLDLPIEVVSEDIICSEDPILSESLPPVGCNMIRGGAGGGGDLVTHKSFKDDLNVIQSTMEEKERNESKEVGYETILNSRLNP